MKALVTGGGGFLGREIVRQLLARGDIVRTFQRGNYPELENLGVEVVRGDLAEDRSGSVSGPLSLGIPGERGPKRSPLDDAVRGVDVVFHVAAKAGVWGDARSYDLPNILGTENLLRAAREAGVRRFVYTSSPSVVFEGSDESGIDESVSHAKSFLAHYPRSKAAAERSVLAANGPELTTVALRPHLIWGPGDPHLVPRIIARAKAGRLRIVGSGDNRVDSTYVENAAAAHLLAADRLAPGAACAGKAYFVSNGEPLAMADLMNRILTAGGLPPVTKHLSARKAYTAGAVMEAAYRLLRIKAEPPMTRFVATQLSTEHWFDLTAIRRDLGYRPLVSIDEGMKRLEQSLRRER